LRDSLPSLFKEREIFSSLRIPKDFKFLAVRCDGRCFHKLTDKLNFKKPYDMRFAQAMVTTTLMVLREWRDVMRLAYTFSDEISFIMRAPFPFSGRIEKLDSLIAATTSSAFTLSLLRFTGKHVLVQFDARLIPLHNEDEVIDYLYSRQLEAWRNFINSVSFYHLVINKHMDPETANKKLLGKKVVERITLLKSNGVKLESMPLWMRRGILIYIRKVKKRGYDPISKREVETSRNVPFVIWSPPLFKSPEGEVLIRAALSQ